MRETTLKLSELACLAATRGMLGAGLGLLLAGRLSPEIRRRSGWALFATGAASTLPLAMKVRENSRVIGPGKLSAAAGKLFRRRA